MLWIILFVKTLTCGMHPHDFADHDFGGGGGIINNA